MTNEYNNESAISNLGVILGGFSTPISLDDSPKDWMKANMDDITNISRSLNVELHYIDGILYPRFFLYILAHLKLCTKKTKQLKLFLKERVKKHPYIDEIIQLADHHSANEWLWGWFNKHKCDRCNADISTSRIEHLLKLDELFIAARIVLLLRNMVNCRKLMQQNDSKSQALLDLFQGLLDRLDLANGIRMPIVSTLVKLSKKSGLHPQFLVLQDVRVVGSDPVAGGGYSDVWKGDVKGHPVALKMMRSAEDIKAYCKEAVLWRQLSSPHVLPFYGIYHRPGNASYTGLVSPWMENGNILQYLKKCPHADKYSLALDVARGIDYLHSFKPPIVHGNLKGANILITPSFTACVADFGLCTLLQDPGVAFTPTISMGTAGSKWYMAPELLVGNEDPEDAPGARSLASDIYSLGCVLHEIFTGNPQFVGFSFPQLVLAHLQNHIPARPPVSEMDDFMWELINQCCNKGPSHRPQASDIIHSLRTRIVLPELDVPLCTWDAEIMDRLRAQSVSSPMKELPFPDDLDDIKESEVCESSHSSGTEISSVKSSRGNGYSHLIYSHLFSHTLELVQRHKPNLADRLHAKYLEWTAHYDEIDQFINHRTIYASLREYLAQSTPKNSGESRSLDDIITNDRNEIASRISTMLETQHLRKVFFEQKGLQAQSILDLLQELLDNLPLHDARPHLVMVLVRLSRESGRYPERLVLKPVQIQGQFPLAGGRYGDIWKGSLDGRAVAVKMMRTYHTQDEGLLKTFAKEAVLWAQLSSPYVLPLLGVYCISESVSRVCLVSPWMDNRNLTQYLEEHPEANRLSLVLDVALGLDYLHSFEPPVIHGDLKGVNILITAERRACVADFGLCILVQNIKIQCTMSTSAHNAGTVHWMAPELLQFEDGPESIRKTCSSDVYAFGCVCFEIYHGEPPFFELNHSQAVRAINENRPRPRPTHTALDDDIWTLIQQCLVTDPEARPGMKQIIQKLECHRDVRHHRTPSSWEVPRSNYAVRQDKAPTKFRLSTLFARGSNTKDRLARKS